MTGLPPLTLVGGTADLLFPDTRRLAVVAAAADVPVHLVEVPGAPHNFPLTTTSGSLEGRVALAGACMR